MDTGKYVHICLSLRTLHLAHLYEIPRLGKFVETDDRTEIIKEWR